MRSTLTQRSRWGLAVVQTALLLVTSAIPVAAAPAPAPQSGLQYVQLMKTYNMIKGDETGDLHLDKPITRAEMITIMVRALGAEAEAQTFKGYSPFSDAKGHWAEGNIAYAAFKKLVKGDDTGLVRPQDPISYNEALALILRMVGKEPTTGTWPVNIIVASAELGLIPDGLTSENLNQPAVRGLIFQSMGRAISTIKTAQGKTFLQTYVDSTPPQITLTTPTINPDAAKAVITGTVDGASAVTVNGVAATLNGTQFSAEVPVVPGTNLIKAEAVDFAGNTASAEITVTRGPAAATLDISGPAKVRPGGSATYTVVAKTAAGDTIPASSLAATVDGNVGTFNLATGILIANSNPGVKGKITVTAGALTKSIDVETMGQDASATGLRVQPVNNGVSVPYTKPMTVQVAVTTQDGSLVDTDYARPVSLSAAGLDGLAVTPAVAYTQAGLATFTVTTGRIGTAAFTATSTGLGTASGSGVFGTNIHVVLVSDPGNLSVGGSTTLSRVKAELRDDKNQLVPNTTDGPISIRLTTDATSGSIVDDTLTISRGLSTSTASGDDGMFVIGYDAVTAVIKGTISTGQQFTVDPTNIRVSVPIVGPGTRLVVAPPAVAEPNKAATYTVRLEDADGNLITTGSYAFQLQVDTSNGETKTNGLPGTISVALGTSGPNPVSDGIAEGAATDTMDVIARTAGGIAYVTVNYDKPGKVTLTPVLTGAYTDAFSSDGVSAAATGTTGFTAVPGTALFQQTPTKVVLTADSAAFGNDQDVAAMANTSAGSVTLRVTLTDNNGNWIPGWVTNVTLSHDGTSTTAPSALTTTTVDGKASFTIRGTTRTGIDHYTVTAAVGLGLTSNTFDVYVQSAKPGTATIAAIRGDNSGAPGRLDYVEADDTGMAIELNRITSDTYVQVLVFADTNTTTPIWSSGAVDVSGTAPRIVVPKKNLPNGSHRYLVQLQNGYSKGDKSEYYYNSVVNAVYNTGIKITSARYDAVSKKLYVYGSGFASGDTIDPSFISLADTSTGGSVPSLDGAVVTVNSSSQLTFDLSGAAMAGVAATLADPTIFSGRDMNIAAAVGWYRKPDGTTAPADLTGNALTPGARIDYVVYDRVNKRLNIYGAGFMTGTPAFDKLKLTVTGGTTYVLSSYGAYRSDDSKLIVPLTSSSAAAVITALENNGSYVLTADDKWFADSGAYELGTTAEIYTTVSLYGVTYSNGVITINGSSLSGSLDLNQLYVMDTDRPATDNLQLGTTGYVTAQDVTATSITLTLSPDAKTWFETKFAGTNIYLVGNAGWLTKDGRKAAATGDRTLVFPRFTPAP